MVESLLTNEMISSGAALVKRLDENGTSPDAAFWFYFDETQAWKLVISESGLSDQGPKEAYRQLQKIILKYSNEIPSITLNEVFVFTKDAPLISLLRIMLKTGPGISGIRLKDNVINGTPIKDSYIYRLI